MIPAISLSADLFALISVQRRRYITHSLVIIGTIDYPDVYPNSLTVEPYESVIHSFILTSVCDEYSHPYSLHDHSGGGDRYMVRLAMPQSFGS